jgi:hypothetical protein
MKKIAAMATIKSRESSLLQTLASIYNQVDEVHVYLNDYEEMPAVLYAKVIQNFKNVKLHFGPNLAGDLGDAAKFYFIDKLPECYYFTIDDDLFYSPGYVQNHIAHQQHFNNQIITTYYGRSFFDFPLQGYYKPGLSAQVRCLNTLVSPQYTQFGGTGVMCIPTNNIKPSLNDFGAERNMADVWVGIYSQRNNVPILALPHKQDDITHNDINLQETIWATSHEKDLPRDVINRELSSLKFVTAVKHKTL